MKKSILTLFVFVICLFSSCNYFSSDDRSEQEKILTKQIHDSLEATGKHGYFTLTFIVGRIKTMPIQEGLPAEINVIKIAPELLGKPLKFKISDSLGYQISYPKNEKEDIVLNGMFSKKAEDEKMQVLVSKSLTTDMMESIKLTDYMFKVHTY